jgi:hypothetical protein
MVAHSLFRPHPSRFELYACRFVLLLTVLLQLEAIHREDTRPISATVASAEFASWDAPDAHHTSSAANESGWIALVPKEKTPSSSHGSDQQLQSGGQGLVEAAAASHSMLDVRPSLDAVKYGRDATRSTTVPPPLV